MNPSTDPTTNPSGDDALNTNPTPVVIPESNTEIDPATLQAIEALEAEDTPITDSVTTDAPTVAVETPVPTAPTTPVTVLDVANSPDDATVVQPSADTQPEAAPLIAAAPIVQATTDSLATPSGTPKKSHKKLAIIIAAVVIFLGLAIGGYFIWQSIQPAEQAETTQQQTSGNPTDQPGGDVQASESDTDTSVTDAADQLESDTETLDDSGYEDATLSDTSLYQN
ncbi:MAG: hypothetical protein WAQ27_06605 [Candidatus Microsaccharimonas sp.]